MAFAASSTAPHGSLLSRKELQSHLKAWKCKATGTTSALLEAYETARREIGGFAPAPARCTSQRNTTAAAPRTPPPRTPLQREYLLPLKSVRSAIDRTPQSGFSNVLIELARSVSTWYIVLMCQATPTGVASASSSYSVRPETCTT
jgi:hypothetical protein